MINDATFKLSFPDGKNQNFEFKAGIAVWMQADPDETENIGRTEGHNLVIGLK